jgi:hypothetical protein
MNPERSAIANLDARTRAKDIEANSQRLLPLYEKIHHQMQKVAIDPRQFIDPYDAEMVHSDIAKARSFVESTSRENAATRFSEQLSLDEVRKLAEIAEYQVFMGINREGWLPYCSGIKTSEYDDVINGIDMVLEYSNQNALAHLGLGIDVTFSQNLKSKFAKIKHSIDTDTLSSIKYFDSPRSGIHGRLSGIPKVVVGLDVPVLHDVMRAKMSNDHVARHLVIAQLRQQLGVFSDYAEHHQRQCASQLRRAQNFVEALYGVMGSAQVLEESNYQKNRFMDAAITAELRSF